MATVQFVLKEPKLEKPTPILALVRFNGKRVNYSTGYSIEPILWDFDARCAIKYNKHSQLIENKIKLSKLQQQIAEDINTKIDNIKVRVNDIFRNFDYKRISPTTKDVKVGLNEEFRYDTLPKNSSLDLNKYVDKFIKDIESGERLNRNNGKRYAQGTVKIYKGFQSMLNEYQKDRHIMLDFSDIDMNFYNDYVKFFRNKDYSTNTIGRHIKTLKVIMRESSKEKLHSNQMYLQDDFRGLSEKVDNIYLSLDELEAIYNADLSKHPERIPARDVFLVGCFTALRFSDYSRISAKHIQTTAKGSKVIRIITKKTGAEVIIPFWHWILEELIEKYPDGMPKTYAQKVNERIKKIGKKAKINENVNRTEYKKGLKLEVTVSKYKMIKTHTARRSGATNMYKHKIPTIDIMKITGHTVESNFLKYIKITKEETADRISKDFKITKPLKKAN